MTATRTTAYDTARVQAAARREAEARAAGGRENLRPVWDFVLFEMRCKIAETAKVRRCDLPTAAAAVIVDDAEVRAQLAAYLLEKAPGRAPWMR